MMPKRKEPELDPKEQFKRFRETAKKLEVEEGQVEKAFRALSKQSAHPQRSDQQPSRKTGK